MESSKAMLWTGRILTALVTVFPVYVAAFIWGGLHLRDPRVRALIPLRRTA
jgi:hypothetical protein